MTILPFLAVLFFSLQTLCITKGGNLLHNRKNHINNDRSDMKMKNSDIEKDVIDVGSKRKGKNYKLKRKFKRKNKIKACKLLHGRLMARTLKYRRTISRFSLIKKGQVMKRLWKRRIKQRNKKSRCKKQILVKPRKHKMESRKREELKKEGKYFLKCAFHHYPFTDYRLMTFLPNYNKFSERGNESVLWLCFMTFRCDRRYDLFERAAHSHDGW